MASHAERARRMADRLGLSEAEIKKRKIFLGISGEEEAALSLLRPFFQQRTPAFVTLLHGRIGDFPETAKILEKAHSQSWLRSRHSEYFVELVSGPYDMAYVTNRLAVGIAHQEIGLEPEWVQASFGLFLEWAGRILREDPASPLPSHPALCDSLSKITLFDSGLVMDSYFMAERERMEVLSRVFETNAEVVWILDSQWVLRHANKTSEKVVGWSPTDLVGKPVEDFLVSGTDSPNPSRKDLVATALREGHWEGELLVEHRNGSRFSVWATVNLLEDDPGRGLILEFRDRTAEKRTERELLLKTNELLRSNRDLEQFAYVASHDLQEPLRMVTSYTQLLARRYQGKLSEEADDFIRFAVDGAVRMQALINALLTYSRVDTRGKPLVATETAAALDQALDNLRLAIRESGAVIDRGSLPQIHGDPVQIMQLFQNLVGNAIKFRSPKGGPRIAIAASREGDFWRFTVSDNGIGIDPRYFERIFTIFQRLHTKEEYPGTGIGLALCKRIVERHGGSIGVRSVPGEGSSFHFTLKAFAGEEAPAVSGERADEHPPTQKGFAS